MHSSSLHSLNSDRGLSKPSRVAWFALNWLNNLFPHAQLDPDLDIRNFVLSDQELDLHWSKISTKSSPARRLSDLFWHVQPWSDISREIGGEIHALEVGCGNGRYGVLLEGLLGDSLHRYVGLDLKTHPGWDQNAGNPKFNLIKANCNSIEPYLEGVNLIITQSALEHFDQDLLFFEQVAKYVHCTQKPVLQIHLMPSAGCLTTFPWHGVRQYTPRTVSRITRLFEAGTRKILYLLGSRQCNKVHRKYITMPNFFRNMDLRENRTAEYEDQVFKAIKQDIAHPSRKEACFHALVLQSNYGNFE